MTTKTKWTPGPWAPSTSLDYFDGGAIVARDGRCFVVAVMTRLEGRDEPNAHLIAAAPELYGALDALLAEVTDLTGESGIRERIGSSRTDYLIAYSGAARAALTKARGEG